MKLKIAMVIMNLGVGGAERVLVNLANHWAKDQDKAVSIISLGSTTPFYPIDTRINVVHLHVVQPSNSLMESLTKNKGRIQVLRSTIKKLNPEVVISFMTTTNALTALATRTLDVTTIVSDRAVPMYTDNIVWQNIARLSYKFVDYLVVQTQGVLEHYDYYPVNKRVIHNALNIPKEIPTVPKIRQEKLIVMVGRLVGFKKMEWGIEAFSRVQDIAEGWHLVIIGEGDHRTVLEERIVRLQLQDKVTLMGKSNQVFSHLKNAEIFLMTSSTEGYPNVLVEAMAMGLPCVSTDCPYGPSEMIEKGKNGALVHIENSDMIAVDKKNRKNRAIDSTGIYNAIAKELRGYMLDEEKRKKHGAAAKNIIHKTHIATIAKQWEDLFQNETAQGKAIEQDARKAKLSN